MSVHAHPESEDPMVNAPALINGEYARAVQHCPKLRTSPQLVPVWREITRGGTDPQIAATLRVSVNTVKTQVKMLRARLPLAVPDEVSPAINRPAVAVHALRHHVFDLAPFTVDRLARPLSERELQVVQAIADGYSQSGAAELLGISPLTVKAHLQRVAEVVGVGRAVIVATRCYRAGLIK